MKHLQALLLLLLISSIAFCQTEPQAGPFQVRQQIIPGKHTVTDAVFINGLILCREKKGHIFFLDTGLNRVDSLTRKFEGQKLEVLRGSGDKVLLSKNRKEVLYLDSSFILRPLGTFRPELLYALYTDDRFEVFGFCGGEFGGEVEFREKGTDRNYYYPATCPEAVIRTGDRYLVYTYLAHMYGPSSFLSIRDPLLLCPAHATGKTPVNATACYKEEENHWRDTAERRGVRIYGQAMGNEALSTFASGDAVYSIYVTDSQTVLMQHQSYQLVPVAILLDYPLYFGGHKTHVAGPATVTTYRYGRSQDPKERRPHRERRHPGLVLIQGGRITLAQFTVRNGYRP